MSALPPKADMCGATSDVRYGPKADTGQHKLSRQSGVAVVILYRFVRNRTLSVYFPETFSRHLAKKNAKAALAVSAAYILDMSPPRLALLKFRLDNRLALRGSTSRRALDAFPRAQCAGRGGSHIRCRV
jgi:hypothetical protein